MELIRTCLLYNLLSMDCLDFIIRNPYPRTLLKPRETRCNCCSCNIKILSPSSKLLPKAVLDIMSAERWSTSLCTSISNSSLSPLSSSHFWSIFLELATISGTQACNVRTYMHHASLFITIYSTHDRGLILTAN